MLIYFIRVGIITISTIVITQSRFFGVMIFSILFGGGYFYYHNYYKNYVLGGIIFAIIVIIRMLVYHHHCTTIPSYITGTGIVSDTINEQSVISINGLQLLYPTTIHQGTIIALHNTISPVGSCITQGSLYTSWIKLSHRISQPSFNYHIRLQLQGIQGTITSQGGYPVIYHTNISGIQSYKKSLLSLISQTFPDQRSAGRVAGTLLGSKDLISKGDYDILVDSGLAHFIVVSGSNLAIISLLLSLVLWRVPLTLRLYCISGGLLGYAYFVGFDSSIIRALCMSLFIIWSRLYGIQLSLSSIITYIIGGFVIINPLSIYDIGLRLSLGAVIGIYITTFCLYWHFFPSLQKRRRATYILSPIVISIGARLGTAPILFWQFGSVNMTSIIANSVAGFIGSLIIPLEISSLILSQAQHYYLVQYIISGTTALITIIYHIGSYTIHYGIRIHRSLGGGTLLLSGAVILILYTCYFHYLQHKIKQLREYTITKN